MRPQRANGRRGSSGLLVAFASLAIAGCEGKQSGLAPAGRGASRIADLFWVMTIGGAMIWALVVALALYATYATRPSLDRRRGRLLVVGGGVVFPVVVLAILLTHSLVTLPDFLALAPEGATKIEVTGLQWWWRVRYVSQEGGPVELANEIHLPVGEPAQLELDSADVIHSFWVPSLGGKVDMIPGRRTRLRLDPTKPGVYRGACAEYCGASHAFMAFYVVVEERAAFDRWLAEQSKPARAPEGPIAERGAARFIANGCGACHSVRGTAARGVIGPDLTHVGGRVSLAAGILPRDVDAFRRWIRGTSTIKPSVHMPAFDALSADELTAVAAYLEGLK
jgi:cytochrome c oxidase subunit II